MDRLVPADACSDLAPGFELSAAVLRHLQADPLLPADLLPPGWPGPRLRAGYDRWDRQYRRVLADWGRSGEVDPGLSGFGRQRGPAPV